MAHKNDIQPGALFMHYKNKDYEIITLATDEATEKPVVVYRALYGDYGAWVRRLESFCETIDIDGNKIERFMLKKAA